MCEIAKEFRLFIIWSLCMFGMGIVIMVTADVVLGFVVYGIALIILHPFLLEIYDRR